LGCLHGSFDAFEQLLVLARAASIEPGAKDPILFIVGSLAVIVLIDLLR